MSDEPSIARPVRLVTFHFGNRHWIIETPNGAAVASPPINAAAPEKNVVPASRDTKPIPIIMQGAVIVATGPSVNDVFAKSALNSPIADPCSPIVSGMSVMPDLSNLTVSVTVSVPRIQTITSPLLATVKPITLFNSEFASSGLSAELSAPPEVGS
ncbi:MAG: hypothetical protein IID45_13725 [Planctomycetes bacterium]|nr:hypothetical protein [Planctomycetota bacterium]